MTSASRYIILTFVAALLTYCQEKQKQTKLPPDTTRQGNIYTTHSRDTARLAKLIDLRTYKPIATEFQYIYIDNSGDGFLSTSGPSDSYLQAVLYFDSVTYSRLLKVCHEPPLESQTTNRISKEDFNFSWLPTGIKEELLKSDSAYHDYACVPFHATLWLLDKKILLKKESI